MTATLRVLMVEDSEDDAILILETLERGGFEVHYLRVETEASLRQALGDGTWDIVLADYCLPSFNAEGTLRVLRETGCDIPAIVVSGTVGEDVAVETIKHGADDYLLKQNLIRLVPAVQHALNAAESHRQRHRLERMKTIILDSSPDLICIFDQKGHFLEVSAASKSMLGYKPAELAGLHFEQLVHPDDLVRLREEFSKVLLGHPSRDFEKRCICKSGEVVYLLWSAAFSKDDGVVVGIGHDITERKQMEEALRLGEENIHRERALLRALIDSIPDLIFFKDRNFNFLGCNRAAEQYLGITESRLIGKTEFDIMPEELAKYYRIQDQKVLASGQLHYSEEDIPDAKGNNRTFDIIKAPFYSPNDELPGLLELCHDITDRKQAEQRIRYLAMYDDLTGLPNRNLIQDRIVQTIAHTRRTGCLLALLYLDLDRFKVVNDGYGHLFGDAVLKISGERLVKLVREEDTVARLGGDEFLILLADLDQPADADIVARKIVESLDCPIMVEGREIYLSGSIGISMFPHDGETADVLIDNADMAMYRAKELGRNTYQFFTREMSRETQHRVDLETKLRGAAAAGQLHLVYQPKVNLENGRIIGCEALLRWHHPELGIVSPCDFIPIAEDSGLIVPIGDWVLRNACAQARRWMDAGLPPVCVAVNLSVRQFLQQDVVAWVRRTLQEAGLPPEWLELELTESLIAQDIEKVTDTIHQLKDIGVKLSIDDFGTGYSSLSYLKRFRVDTLKIDRSFVHNMLAEMEDATIVLAIISLAHNLGFKVIAEGVETEQDCHFLRLNHCDEIQGYYFSRPAAAEEFETMLYSGKQLA
ncbi:EAL domain-containing protein [Methylobacillus caricis]|uniref:EAL domain-containing protein n=1 Tax=Methylobacillus caricis TaxID=1971611 RepID=UPI001CFF92B8|nr:EAL domain-containing protein [Methylobacillus caricis]MCB5189051.1 EAL domain-containing protein [Methylobacillus caricis]